MISSSKFYSVLNSLLRKSLVEEHNVNLGGRGGSAKYVELTDAGFEAIEMKPRPHLTRGGNFITDLFIFKISKHLKKISQNWKISIEKEIQGKFIDIVIELINQSLIIAIEIELSDANLKNNIDKDIDKVDFLIVACGNKDILKEAEKIKKDLSEQSQNKIVICLLTQLLKCKNLNDLINFEFEKDEKNKEKP